MAITAKDVQALREMTGVGMMDCKKALTEAEGDFDKAIEWLREKGLAAQTKKAGKVAAEGVSYAIVADNGVGVVIEVNSQTDFVAKNADFQQFVSDVANVVIKNNPVPMEMVGVEDRFGQVGAESFLREEYGLTAAHIVEAAKKAIDRKNG